MLKTLMIATLTLIAVPAATAHAEPNEVVDEGANYRVFIEMLNLEGIDVDPDVAIAEGLTVCTLADAPNSASLWDLTQHVQSKHPDWTTSDALNFADRAIQNICPHRGTF